MLEYIELLIVSYEMPKASSLHKAFDSGQEARKKPEEIKDGIDFQMPKLRLTATGQVAIATISLTFCGLFICDKTFQLLLCICRRLNAAPQNENRYVENYY